MLRNHPLLQTLRELKGNPRVTVLTEIMFGIPFNMYAPFFSVYMLAFGITDQQIGSLTSLGLVVQIFSALLSGAIVDKFGRRLTLFIADIASWSVPCLVWAIAQDFRYFLVAALINGLWRISHTAWTCLMVEDAEERHLVHIWTWIMIFAVCSQAFTPLGGWVVKQYGLTSAMRGIFVFGFIMFALKAIVLYTYSHETERGVQRITETKHSSILSLVGDYRSVFNQLIYSKAILGALSLVIITNIYTTVSGSFWGILFTTKLGFPESDIASYVFIRSIIMAFCFFVLGPRFTNLRNFRPPLWLGFGIFIISQFLLVAMPPHATTLLVVSVVLESIAAALVAPMTESLLASAMESKERARMTAIVYVTMIFFISPFGWIAGQLSALDRALSFALNIGLFILGIFFVSMLGRSELNPLPEPTTD